VNFGVAEHGAICILTNEGNGRMVTTLPDVHIALMGIERLVPNMGDLAHMLYLLPRSATGQKLTVYANLIFGPRREGEPEGSSERHLILVDNGRSLLQRSSLKEALYCIRCGACLNACPVFREIGGHAYVGDQGQGTPYPGPIGSVVSPGLFGLAQFGHLARASSLCGACKEACPIDIDLPGLLLRVRAAGKGTLESQSLAKNTGTHAHWMLKTGLGAFTWMATSARRFAAAQSLAGFASRLLSPFSNWMRLPSVTGWGYSRDFPRPAARTFRERFPGLAGNNTQPSIKPTHSHQGDRSESSNIPTPIRIPVERFAQELEILDGVFTRCREDELAGSVQDLLAHHQITRIQAWEARWLPDSLLDSLRAAGFQVTHQADPNIQAGLTGALAGIAETGTLVLPAGPGRPLTASLLPELHIAILRASEIHPDLRTALAGERLTRLIASTEASSVVLISGPSRTADIEMALTIGVHGPGQVFVFCLDDS
jgi:L-lactate dehydrogenase complex protein LldF